MKLRKLVTSIGLVLLGGCSFQASCNSGRTLDMKNAEALVRTSMAKQAGVEPTVDCPDRVKIEKGARFDCQIAFGEVKGVVTLEQKDDQTYVEVVGVTGVLWTTKLEALIAERANPQAKDTVKVDCGPTIRAAVPGETFRCQVTDGSGAALEIEVKVKDTTGNVDFAPVPQAPSRAPTP